MKQMPLWRFGHKFLLLRGRAPRNLAKYTLQVYESSLDLRCDAEFTLQIRLNDRVADKTPEWTKIVRARDSRLITRRSTTTSAGLP